MSEEYTLEDHLEYQGEIDRFNIGCGSYGDSQWQVWDDQGEYVEFQDHENIVNIYKQEIARLRRPVQ